MANRIPALVEPPILVWARERASMSLPEAATRLEISVEKLAAWENGSEQLYRGTVMRQRTAPVTLPI